MRMTRRVYRSPFYAQLEEPESSDYDQQDISPSSQLYTARQDTLYNNHRYPAVNDC